MAKSSPELAAPADRMDDLDSKSASNIFRISVYLLAAEVSTLGGIALPGLRNPGPFVGAFLKGPLAKLPYESGGGVAAQDFISTSLNIFQENLRSPPPHT